MRPLRYDYTGCKNISEGADWFGIYPGLRPHFHEEIQVSASLYGLRQYLIGSRCVILRPAQLLLLPSYAIHHALPTNSCEVRSMEFYLAPSRLSAAVAAYLHGLDHQIVDAPWLLDELPDRLPERVINELEKLTSWVPICPDDSKNRIVRPLLEALALGDRLSDVGERLGLTPEGYIKSFTRQVGTTPHAYRINMRLNLARRLLRDGLSLVDVADIAGFSDQSHFSRFFLACFGTTPGRFRSVHRRT